MDGREKDLIKIGQEVYFDSLVGKVIKIFPLPEISNRSECPVYKIGVVFDKTNMDNFIPFTFNKAKILVSDKSLIKQLFCL